MSAAIKSPRARKGSKRAAESDKQPGGARKKKNMNGSNPDPANRYNKNDTSPIQVATVLGTIGENAPNQKSLPKSTQSKTGAARHQQQRQIHQKTGRSGQSGKDQKSFAALLGLQPKCIPAKKTESMDNSMGVMDPERTNQVEMIFEPRGIRCKYISIPNFTSCYAI